MGYYWHAVDAKVEASSETLNWACRRVPCVVAGSTKDRALCMLGERPEGGPRGKVAEKRNLAGLCRFCARC